MLRCADSGSSYGPANDPKYTASCEAAQMRRLAIAATANGPTRNQANRAEPHSADNAANDCVASYVTLRFRDAMHVNDPQLNRAGIFPQEQ